jgi:hypothetical protein
MLLRLCEDGVLTRPQLLSGLRVMLDLIEDYEVDAPRAFEYFAIIVAPLRYEFGF